MFELSKFQTTFWANLTPCQDSSNLQDHKYVKKKIGGKKRKRRKKIENDGILTPDLSMWFSCKKKPSPSYSVLWTNYGVFFYYVHIFQKIKKKTAVTIPTTSTVHFDQIIAKREGRGQDGAVVTYGKKSPDVGEAPHAQMVLVQLEIGSIDLTWYSADDRWLV
jgi:hypothetical protein